METLTANEAAVAAGVTVAEINRMIDERILPERLYSTSDSRTFRKDACLWVAFYFETAEWLTAGARLKTIRDGLAHRYSWAELRDCRLEDSRTVQVAFSHIWDDVDRRLHELKEAEQMVVKDPYILSGTPVVRGTRIPAYDVASLYDADTPMDEILEIYPRLRRRQVELVALYAKANPQRGRPPRRVFPEGTKVSITTRQIRLPTSGASAIAEDSD